MQEVAAFNADKNNVVYFEIIGIARRDSYKIAVVDAAFH